MMVGLIAYCTIVLVIRPKGYLRGIGSILLVIFFNAAGLALSMFALWRTQGWRVTEAFSYVQKSLGSKYFGFGSWEILVFFSQIWSQFLNPVLLALSILGVIVLARRRDRLTWIVLAWIIATCATNVAAAPMSYNPLDVNRGQTQIFRALFLTPFQVPATIGLLHLKSALDRRMERSPRGRIVASLAIALLFLAIVNGTFRALFPLLTDPHNYPNPLNPPGTPLSFDPCLDGVYQERGPIDRLDLAHGSDDSRLPYYDSDVSHVLEDGSYCVRKTLGISAKYRGKPWRCKVPNCTEAESLISLVERARFVKSIVAPVTLLF
jgi:hypothetical protein